MAIKSECGRILVAAMDFGTSFSGYAFSFSNDPMKVQTNQAWVAGSTQLISLKTTTCILLTPRQEFHSFGYEAENKYADLALDGVHKDWYFFKKFKMLLHNTEGLKQNTMIEDASGRKMQAMTIFSLSIKYLKDHLMATIQNRVPGIVQEDVHFVITVPAIWDDKAKQFMRDAAVKAGISNDQLSVVLEPEAAAIWCQRLESLRKSQPSSSSVERIFRPGKRYMVVDLGGGTVDIAVHEIKRDRSLGELYKASGGPWGGTCVDKNFLSFIGKIMGQDFLVEFARREMSDYIDLLREFETKKRTIKSSMDGKVSFKIPSSMLKMFEEKGCDVKSATARSGFEMNVSWVGEKLRVDPFIVIGFFNESVQNTINHVRKLLSDPSLRNVNTIILVGGFAECELFQDAFKRNFKREKIIIPEEGGLVILKGAVISGHVPKSITTRIARFTYGIAKTPKFDPDIHPIEKRKIYDGIARCRDVFNKFVEIGEVLETGHTISRTGIPLEVEQRKVHYHLYTSTEKSPRFVTDPSCRLLGKFSVPLPEGTTIDEKEVERSMTFGDTELMFRVKHPKTGKEFKTYFTYE
ncbi:hypothetical protein CHS0354_026199 [Potamilus streckersoni]|nr:hypothetical protein CHS0354_026199 [Potamilus streckersoni]